MFYTPVDKHSSEAENDSIMMNKTERLSDFSSKSIVCAMDRFVKAVNNMNETIMVPSRLLDMSVEDKLLRKVPSMLQENANPHNLYNELNCVKNELIRGLPSNDDDEDQNNAPSPIIYNTPWFVSPPTTTISKTSSTSDFESEDDWDAGMASEEGTESTDMASDVMETLRYHLVRLQLHLNSLTNTAAFITDSYKIQHTT